MPRQSLPYVNSYRDRNGKMRHYLRRKGMPQVPLPGRMGTKAFLRVYEKAMATTPELMPNLKRLKDAGHIYYVQDGDFIKIGFATDVSKRMDSYATHRAEIVLLGHHPGTRADEKALHEKFKEWRLDSREWFRRNWLLLAHIQEHSSRTKLPKSAGISA